MLKFKKGISLVLTVCVLLAFIFAGCVSQDTSTDKEDTSSPVQDDEQSKENNDVKEELKFVELTWYYVGSPQPDVNLIEEEINKILKEEINASVSLNCIDWGSYDERMRMMIAASETFDISFTANWSNNYYTNVSRGAFLPLDDLLKAYAPGLYDSISEDMWDATRVEGEIYGVINQQIAAMTNGLVLQKELVEKHNFDIQSIHTLKDFEPFFELVKKYEEDITPIDLLNPFGTLLVYYGFDEVSGRYIPGVIRLEDEDTTVINQFESPEFKEFITLMRSWYENGYIQKDVLTNTDTSAQRAQGRFATLFEGNSRPGGAAQISTVTAGIEWIQVPISDSYLLNSSIIATMNAISRTSNNPERAMMFLEVVNTNKDVYNLIAFGIEGIHYNKVSDTHVELVDDSNYNPGTDWVFGNVFNSFYRPGQLGTEWEETAKINREAKPSPMLGFVFNPAPVNSQIAQCQAVVDEFLTRLTSGVSNPDDVLPQFLDQLKRAGAQEIIDEKQRQIDDWKGTR